MSDAAELRARLERSRAALLRSLEGLTERDFSSELAPGETVIGLLARLAPAEREAVRAARGEAQPSAGGAAGGRSRPLPPPVIHDLAGARYETLAFLEAAGAELDPEVRALIAGIAEREEEAARRIEARAQPSKGEGA